MTLRNVSIGLKLIDRNPVAIMLALWSLLFLLSICASLVASCTQQIPPTTPAPTLRPNPDRDRIYALGKQAQVNDALSRSLHGEHGRMTVRNCDDGMDSDACREVFEYSLRSESAADDCFELHRWSRRCLDLYDADGDGELGAGDRQRLEAVR